MTVRAFVVLMLLALPSTARGAIVDVTLDGGKLTISDRFRTDGEGVTIGITRGDTTARLQLAIPFDAGDAFGDVPTECQRLNRLFVACQEEVAARVTRIEARLGDGDDSFGMGGNVRVPLTADGRAGRDTITGGAGADVIDVGEASRAGGDVAFGQSGDDVISQTFAILPIRPLFPGARLDGGPGNDRLTAFPVTARRDLFDGREYVLNGSSGDDVIVGGGGDDRIDGFSGNDRITAGGGGDLIDTFDGDDVVNAGAGDDTVDSGLGTDQVDAGPGDDRVVEIGNRFAGFATVTFDANGSDELQGGAGDDTIDYSARNSPLSVFGNDQTANDGADAAAGEERDNVIGFERIIGGGNRDFLFAIVSLGDDIPDDLRGGDAADTLLGGDGDDRLEGGQDVDTMRGGSDDDVLLANDGEADAEVACNSGNGDRAFVDLRDPAPTGCELVERQPVREEPNVEVRSGRTLRRSGGRVRILLRCPLKAKAGCRGTVSLSRGAARRSGSYRLRAGRRGVVALRIVPPGRAIVVARQRGRKGPKTTTAQVRVR